MDERDQLLIETSQQCKANTKRISELAKEHVAIHELALSVKEIALNTQNIQKQLSVQGEKIAKLEQIPAQKWANLVKTVVSCVVTTIIGGILGAALTLILK